LSVGQQGDGEEIRLDEIDERHDGNMVEMEVRIILMVVVVIETGEARIVRDGRERERGENREKGRRVG
jgi:hypothetical protein